MAVDTDALRDRRQLEVLAALKGRSIEDCVPSRALVGIPDPAAMTDAKALQALKQLLAPASPRPAGRGRDRDGCSSLQGVAECGRHTKFRIN